MKFAWGPLAQADLIPEREYHNLSAGMGFGWRRYLQSTRSYL